MRKEYIIIVLTLLFINSFGLISLSNTILLLLILVLAVLGYNKNRQLIFTGPIVVMIVGLILSMISCKIYRGQDYGGTFKALVNYLYILLYFAIAYIKPSVRQMEKSLFTFIIMFNVIYIMQFVLLQVGVVIIKSAEGYESAGESARFRMIASGFTSLGLFFGLNKYLMQKKKKYIGVIISSVTVLLLMGFRTMIFFSVVFSFYLLIKIYGFSLKTLGYFLGVGVFCVLLLQIPIFKDKVQYMVEKNEEQNLSNDDYIRVITLKYYLHDYFKSNWEMFFGSGPMFVGSEYNDKIMKLQKTRGIYYQDWGLLGLSWVTGILSVFGMLWYSIKAFMQKVPPSYFYLGIWFLYLVIASITTAEFYRLGNYAVQALVLFTIENVIKETDRYENRNIDISSCS